MWPKYPKQASRLARLRNTAAAMRTSKRAGGSRCGPSRTRTATMRAAIRPRPEANSRVCRHDKLPMPRIRYGEPEPMVSPPIRRPMASPRPSRNHVAMIFIAGGYAPARHIPVITRSTSAGPRLSTHSATAALASAAAAALHVISRFDDQMSGRLPSALASVPRMKPSWTAMVRLAVPPLPRCHSRRSTSRTADALNQGDRASSSATASAASTRQRAAPASGAPELDEDATGSQPPGVEAHQDADHEADDETDRARASER